MAVNRDNVRAGLFVVAGAILTLVVVYTLTDLGTWLERKQSVTVYYTLADGLQGLKVGSDVTLGDQAVGSVTAVTDAIENQPDGSQRVKGVNVTFELPDKYKLYDNAAIEVKGKLIGSGATLNVRSLGSGQRYTQGSVIAGSVASNPLTKNFVTDIGIREEQKEQMRQVIANVASITKTVDERLPGIMDKLDAILADAGPAVSDARLTVSNARETLAQLKVMVDAANAHVKTWFERIDSISADAQVGLANARDITQTLKDKTLAQITEALDKADAAVSNVKQTTDDLKVFVNGQRPILERALANAQITTDQLKLAAVEVRRSPWRLLYSPKDKELVTDDLYDSARSFALAAGSLQAAADSLRATSTAYPDDKQSISQMLDHLEKLFTRYSEAEDRFWKAIEASKK
ncbi:MAG: hypothetical protein GC164_10670 [Phycisphaera sp.]|nr:hypothetical protein [Phycisphaera sp.]